MIDYNALMKAERAAEERWAALQGMDPPPSKYWLDVVSVLTAKVIASEGKDSFAVSGTCLPE